jgi:hypothetical protein
MALTPEKIQALDAVTGFKTPTSPQGVAASNRANEIRNLAKQASVSATSAAQGGTDTNFGDVFGNILPSAGRAVKDVATAVMNPIDTAKGVGKIALGAAEKLIPGTQKHEEAANAVGQFFKDRYGSIDNVKQTFINDPVGFALDLSTVLTGGGAAISKVGQVSKIGEIAKVGGAIAKAGSIIDPIKAAATGAGKVAKPVVGAVGSAAKKVAGSIPEKLMSSTLKLNPTDVRRIELPSYAGMSPEKWLLERQISGSIDDITSQLDTIRKTSKSTVDSSLAGIKQTINVEEKIPQVKQALVKVKEVFGDTPGNEDLVSKIDSFLNKPDLTFTEINEVKRLLDREMRIFKTTGEVAGGATARGLENIRDSIKTFIEEEAKKYGIDNIKELNKETQVAVEIRKAILKKQQSLAGNRVFGLTDILVGVGGTAAASPIGGLLSVALKKYLLENPKLRTALANRLQKLSTRELDILEDTVITGEVSKEVRSIMSKALEALKENPAVASELLIIQGVAQEGADD